MGLSFFEDSNPQHGYHSSNSNPCLLCCSLSFRLLYLPSLKKVPNAAARLVRKAKKSDHIQPILQSLPRQPVTHRIHYKISTICFSSLSGKFPKYQSNLTQPYTPTKHYVLHLTPLPSSSLVQTQNYWAKDHSLIPPNLSGTICLGQSITLILLHHSKSLLKPTFSKTVSKLSVFFTADFFSVIREWCVCVCVCTCVCACMCVGGCVNVAIAIVKRPVLPLYV